MSIFGIGTPKYVRESVTTTLNFCRRLKDQPEYNLRWHESEINQKVYFNKSPYHWIFSVLIHLYKYADPKAQLLLLQSHLHSEVKLWRHSDGSPVSDNTGSTVMFGITEVTPIYLEQSDWTDGVIMKFRSVSPNVDLSQDWMTDLGYGFNYGSNYGVNL